MTTNNTEKAKSIRYQRRKAVRDAWAREVKLVKQGKATRNWTLEEQRELLLTGRIKGYVGHHIKSVKKFPQYAGEEKNIQFLTRKEHYKVHFGNWKDSIGKYYDPERKIMKLGYEESVSLTLVRLNEKLSEQEKLSIYKEQKLQQEKNKMSEKTCEEFEEEFRELAKKEKESYMSIYSRNTNLSVQEVAGAFQREKMSVKDGKAITSLEENEAKTLAYEMKNGKTGVLQAVCEKYAAEKMINKYNQTERHFIGSGSVLNEGYKNFIDNRIAFCQNKIDQNNAKIENIEKNFEKSKINSIDALTKEQKEAGRERLCLDATNLLYEKQQKKWEISMSEGLNKANSQNHDESQKQTTSQTQSRGRK